MNSNWVRKPLGEVVSLQRGYDLPIQKRVLGNVPIMGSAGITGWHNEAKMKASGVVVGRTGNLIGEVHYCDADYWPLNTCLFVTNFKGNDERFIYLLLQSVNFEQFNSGSAQQSLNLNAVYPYEVKLPESKEEQAKIANVIFDITDKIRLNNQTNQTLEAIAQAIFKSWFVDFEPVKAKIAAIQENEDVEGVTRAAMRSISGKAGEELNQLLAEKPDHYTKLKTTAELFPAAMQDSDFGEIPEGWEIKKLSDICTKVIDGTHDSPKPSEDGYYLVTGKNIVNGSIDFSNCYKISPEDHEKVIKRSKPEEGDIIFSNIGTLGSTVLVDQNFEFSIKNVALFKPLESIYSRYLYLHFSSAQTQKLLIQKATETTQIFFSLKFLRDLELITPLKYIISKFDEIVQPFFEERSLINQTNQNLCDLRDFLLPKLLSGELLVDAAEFAEADA